MRTILLLLLLAATAQAKPRKVAVVVYNNAEILDFAGPTEVLSAAGNIASEDGQPALEVYLVAKTTQPIQAQGFVTITPTYSIDSAPRPDVVVIPGGAVNALYDDPEMMKWLADVTGRSEVTMSVCNGALALAKTGALDGLTVTTHFNAIEHLRKEAPKAHVEDGRRFVDNGHTITTAGVSAGIDGALHLTARLLGRRVADQTARYMEYHWTPEAYLAKSYAYWNPSTDDRGRSMQQASAALEEHRPAEAIAMYRRAGAWIELGDALFGTGDYAGALAAYTKLPATAKGHAHATYNAACALAKLGRTKEAVARAKEAIAAGIPADRARGDSDLASIKDQL
ncbi:MAG: DJ-1/PfpI family protein [Deltaproteobacteria bacterium]|nr:DJ-1/PfpI family protein [Deltaproteobacteria bacterium]